MAGYKLGQKVLLSDGTLKSIENVQLGDQLFSFDIPEIVVGVDFREIESLTLNTQEVLTPGVTETYVDSGNYLQINGLGVIDENILAYHRNENRYQFVSTIELTVGGEFDMVRYVDGQIVHEEVESKEIVYSTDSLHSLTLSGPSYYVLDGYIVHNVGYCCIRDCKTQSAVACIQNVYNFSIGSSFTDQLEACWEVIAVGSCPENCPSANISYVGSVVQTFPTGGCNSCAGAGGPVPYGPGMPIGDYNTMGLTDPCCAFLIPCIDIDFGNCSTCNYQYAYQYVNLTNLTPCPNAGQVVKLTGCDNCCYFIEGIVPDCEEPSNCTATVFETCSQCCTESPASVTPTPTRTPTRTPTPTRTASIAVIF